MDGNKYKYRIYTGCKPAALEEIPTGRLLCKGVFGKPAKIITTGTAGYFVIFKMSIFGQEIAGYGTIGTSGGYPMTISSTSLVKGCFFTVG